MAGSAALKIGSTKDRASAISTANAETIVVRGRDLCRDLIGSLSFTQYFWLLVTGEAASAAQARVLDACLVAIAEHGLVPSVQAARMTYAAGPEAMQGAVAAGILGCGSVILGSAENAGRFLSDVCQRAEGGDLPAALLDAGFPLAGMKGVPILARTASLVAHLVEEQARAIGFALSEAAETGIAYDGAVPPGFTA